MAATVQGFRDYFAPTFNTRGDTELATSLALIEKRVSDLWGERRDEMVYLKLADMLESMPAGRAARVKQGEKGPTVYSGMIKEMEKANAWGRSRLGTP